MKIQHSQKNRLRKLSKTTRRTKFDNRRSSIYYYHFEITTTNKFDIDIRSIYQVS